MVADEDGSRIADPDRAYRLLLEAHRGLDDDASAALNARLVLVLMNEVGDLERIAAAIRLAKASERKSP